MLNLLVKINKKVALRVQAIIDTNDPRFKEEYITHLKTNINRKLGSDDRTFAQDKKLRAILSGLETIDYS
mgnify:CR=1 FL=1